MKRKINFIGIGVQKAGTSWLAQALNEHPEIYIHPKKEAHYFNHKKTYINRFHYEWTFKNNNEKIVGDITPSYISDASVAEKIFTYNPDVKMIVILRDPTERCISQYIMEMTRGTIEKNSGLWDAFSRDLPSYGPMKARGMYKEQLNEYYKFFKKEQILILQYKELQKNPEEFIKKAFNFLEVDSSFIPECLSQNIKHKKDIRKKINISNSDIKKVNNFYDSFLTTES
ncbi:sulfotransferase domain-containing protein [bacterium]|nr:sulfotransferase domain-containing protein [bacterium]